MPRHLDFLTSSMPIVSLYSEFQELSEKLGQEQAWKIIVPKVQALGEKLADQFPEMGINPKGMTPYCLECAATTLNPSRTVLQ